MQWQSANEHRRTEMSPVLPAKEHRHDDGEGGRSKRMPPHGDIIQVLENVYTKGIYRACIVFGQGLKMKNKG